MIVISIGLKGPDWNVFLLGTRFKLNFVEFIIVCVNTIQNNHDNEFHHNHLTLQNLF